MKFYIYAVVIMGIMILLAAAGMDMPSVSLVKSLNIFDSGGEINFQNFKSSTLWSDLLTLLALATVGGVIIGAFSRITPESYLTATIISLITGLIAGDMLYLFVQLNSFGQTWITWGALALLAPLTLGLLLTGISYWRGSDG